jgi:hypothetical protein
VKKKTAVILLGAAAITAIVFGIVEWRPHARPVVLSPAALARTGSVNERFLSYNIEMVELTGGRFWRPYDDAGARKGDDRYEYRPPLDLGNARLRKLAAALAPSYVRYSGTWANATYFDDSDEMAQPPPAGFDTVLTRAQWRGAVEFARAVGAGVVMSFATSSGARDAAGVWQPDNSARLLRYTQSLGGNVAAAEFANEPNMIELTKPPAGYTPADYRRDYGRFHEWIREASPQTLVLAPGSVELGEPLGTITRLHMGKRIFEAEELMATEAHRPDAVSFHFYGGASQRCHVPLLGTKESGALDEDWLSGIDAAVRRTAALRDRFAPGAPLWISESGESACGGNPWAKGFTDAFRFTDQLARSARQGVQVFMHNTLAASDYALLDEHSFAPRPDYWAAWLWRTFMGTTVLDAGAGTTGLHVYAHCLRDVPGGVAVLAINLDRNDTRTLQLDGAGKLFALTQGPAGPAEAALNGKALELGPDDALPVLHGVDFEAGELYLAPASINFLSFEGALSSACR